MSDPTTYGGVPVGGLTIEKLARKTLHGTYKLANLGIKGDGSDEATAMESVLANIPDGSVVEVAPGMDIGLGSTLDIINRQGLTILYPSWMYDSSEANAPKFTWLGSASGTMVALTRSRLCKIIGMAFKANGTNHAGVCVDIDGYASGQIGSECYLVGNVFHSDDAATAFIGVRISETTTNNQEYHRILGNRFTRSSYFKQSSTGAISGGSNTLTVGSSFFVAGDVGQRVRVEGADTGGTLLDTTITSFTSVTSVLVSATAVVTVTSAYVQVGERLGVGVQIGASPNAKRQVIEQNSFAGFAKGIYAKNGSFRSISNNFSGNEINIYLDDSSESCVDDQPNSELSCQHLYYDSALPMFVRAGRFAVGYTKLNGGYFEITAQGANLTVMNCCYEQDTPTDSTIFDLTNAGNNCHLVCINNNNPPTNTRTMAEMGYEPYVGAYVYSLNERNITDLPSEIWSSRMRSMQARRDSQDFSTGLFVAGTNGGVPTAIAVEGRADPLAGSGYGTILVGVQGVAGADPAYAGSVHYRSVQAAGGVHDSGTALTYCGFRAESPGPTGGATIVTGYGLYVDSVKVTNVTTGYGIYIAGADDINYMAGPLRLGKGISGTSTSANNLRGSVTFATAATAAVSFGTNEPNATYYVALSGSANETFWVTSKATTGFTINSSNGSSTATVDWLLIR